MEVAVLRKHKLSVGWSVWAAAAVSVFLIGLSFMPTLIYWRLTPPGTVYLGTYNYDLDYFIHLSNIIQGQRGDLLRHELHTSEADPGTLAHFHYLATGWVSGLFRITPQLAFHLSRLFAGVFLAVVVYWFTGFFVEKNSEGKRILLFILTYASAALPVVQRSADGLLAFSLPLSNWSGIDVVRRVAFLPHGTFQNALFLLCLGLLIRHSLRQTFGFKPLIFAGICLLFLNLYSPFHGVIVLLSFGTYSLVRGVQAIFRRNYGTLKKFILENVILLGFFAPTALYVLVIYSYGPLHQIKVWEIAMNIAVDWVQYTMSIGPTFYLGLLGLIFAVKKGGLNNWLIILSALATTVFLMSPSLDKTLGISNFRFLGIPVYVFWGILAFYPLEFVIDKFIGWKRAVLLCGLPLFIMVISIPAYLASIREVLPGFPDLPDVGLVIPQPNEGYLSREIYSALFWLKENTNVHHDVVLSKLTVGNMIPGISGNKVYFGHPVSTMNFYGKWSLVDEFFGAKMSQGEGKQLVEENGIRYVYQGAEEGGAALTEQYPFLNLVYENSQARIYRVSQ